MRMDLRASRREFVKKALAGAALLQACGGARLLATEERRTADEKTRVVLAHDPLLRGNASSVDSQRALVLLDRAMQALFERDHSLEAWRQVVKPGELVSVKVNTLGGRGIASSPVLVEAICERLQETGIRAADITVWDRDTEEMERAGFRIAEGGERVQYYGTDRVDYEDDLVMHGSVGSRLSRILTRRTDVLINVPVLKDHDGAGVTLALKNMYGAIHNPNKYHPDGCNPYVADVNMLAEIRAKMRLCLCDATTAMYEGGPGYKPEHSWQANSLLAAQDAVALDWTGWQMIERKRAEHGLKTLAAEQREPRYIATAADAEHRLGTNDPRRIQEVEV